MRTCSFFSQSAAAAKVRSKAIRSDLIVTDDETLIEIKGNETKPADLSGIPASSRRR